MYVYIMYTAGHGWMAGILLECWMDGWLKSGGMHGWLARCGSDFFIPKTKQIDTAGLVTQIDLYRHAQAGLIERGVHIQ